MVKYSLPWRSETKSGDYFFKMGVWCSGNTWVSKTYDGGSIPSTPANLNGICCLNEWVLGPRPIRLGRRFLPHLHYNQKTTIYPGGFLFEKNPRKC